MPEDDPPRPRFLRRELDLDRLPDVRDGLTRLERVILWQLSVLEKERGGRMVPSAQLYGRVVEYVDVGEREFLSVLARLMGNPHGRKGRAP